MDMIQAALPQAVESRDTLALAADAATVLMGLAVLVLVIVLVLVALEFRSTFRELRIGVRQNLGPVSDRARKISDNLEFITDAARADIRHLNRSVRALGDRLQQASDHMEERIEEFNALVEAVQVEAEELFFDTAASVHGIREGARAIGNHRNKLRDPLEALPARPDPADHEERPVDPERVPTREGLSE